MSKRHVMVDIESFGPDQQNGATVQIGAVYFDFTRDNPVVPDIALTIMGTYPSDAFPAFFENISLSSAMNVGLKVDAEAILWWMGKGSDAPSEQARESLWNPNPLPIRDVLKNFREFVKGADHVWAWPVSFDLNQLRAAYQAIGSVVPWRWRDAMDSKTYMFGVPWEHAKVEPYGIEHHALWDACHQASRIRRGAAYKRKITHEAHEGENK